MAMGQRKVGQRRETLWISTSDLPRSEGDSFYERLNGILGETGFDAYVEGVCKGFYADRVGRPSLAPGNYFRLLLVGSGKRFGRGGGPAVPSAERSPRTGLDEHPRLAQHDTPRDPFARGLRTGVGIPGPRERL